ncbi:MAG: tetraacyldisaccharide 4'-kinase [Acetobacteraceae bacterium]
MRFRPPEFWQHSRPTRTARALSPISLLVAGLTAKRVARSGWRAPVPVICCGNVTMGGSGKTTLALDLAHRLLAHGLRVHFLSRGYGGSAGGGRRVQREDPAALVGDEALLLAAVAPTWVGSDRAASARSAVEAGAEVLVLDDGLQNATLHKDLSLLVVDGGAGFGNGLVLPAGPLREPIRAGAVRCQAAVLIGCDHSDAIAKLPGGLPVLRAKPILSAEVGSLKGQPVVAFAGLARPEKFFAALENAGVTIRKRIPFADHHPYSVRDLRRLLRIAAAQGAVAVTTPKDAARLSAEHRKQVRVIGVSLEWDDAGLIETLLGQFIKRRNTSMNRSMSASSL